MTFDKAFRPAICLSLIAILFVCQIAIRLGSELNHDTVWFIYVARGMLDGGELYRDFVEVNPPLAIWLTLPAMMFSRATGLAPVETVYGVFFALTALSLFLVRRFLAKIREMPDWTKELTLVLLAAAFLFIPASSFGQREHLLALLFVPWVILRFARSKGASISVSESALIGLLASVAICLKPHAVAAPIAVEAFLLLRGRDPRLIIAPENLGAVVFAAAYGLAIAIWSPLFLSEIVHFGITAYIPYYGFNAAVILERCLRPATVLALALVLQHFARGPMRELSGLALAAASGFFVAYLFQAKGYFYQIMPAQIFAAVGGIFALAGILDALNTGKLRKLLVIPASIVVILITLLNLSTQVYVSRSELFAAAISQHRRGAKSFFIASTNVFNGFPLAVRENLVWASRFPALWLIPYVADRWHDGPLPDDPIIAYTLDALVTDLLKFHPDVVFISHDPDQDYVKGGTFDYLKFMHQDPRFEAIWNTYELRGQAGKFAVYVAKSP